MQAKYPLFLHLGCPWHFCNYRPSYFWLEHDLVRKSGPAFGIMF